MHGPSLAPPARLGHNRLVVTADDSLLRQPLGALGRACLIWFGIEFTAYLIAIAVKLNNGASLLSALGDVLIIFIAIRVVMVAGNFAQTWWHRSPRAGEHRIGLFGTLKMFGNELIAAIGTYPFYFAFEPWLVPNRPKPGLPHQGPPIILVPGFLCNRGYWGSFRRFLTKQGYGKVYSVTLGPVFGSITENARQLGEFIEAVCAETGEDKVILVAHSMGGVTIRAYLHKLDGAHRVAKVIAIGAPFKGTVLAGGPSGLGANLKQMVVGNPWSEGLNACEAEAAPVPFVAIWSPHDSIVAPQEGSRISDIYGKSIAVPGVGHMEMVTNRPCMELTLREIREVSEIR